LPSSESKTCYNRPTSNDFAESPGSSSGRRGHRGTVGGPSSRLFPGRDAPSHDPTPTSWSKDRNLHLIQVTLIEGVFDAPEKAAMIEKLTGGDMWRHHPLIQG
jgi:hypothetical protein